MTLISFRHSAESTIVSLDFGHLNIIGGGVVFYDIAGCVDEYIS